MKTTDRTPIKVNDQDLMDLMEKYIMKIANQRKIPYYAAKQILNTALDAGFFKILQEQQINTGRTGR